MAKKIGWIALEAGPYFWNAETIYNFLSQTFNIIEPAVTRIRIAELAASEAKSKKRKHVNSSDKIESKEDIKKRDFVNQLSGQSKQVFGDTKWVDVIGTDDYNTLKLHENGKGDTMQIDNDEPKKSCVVQLLRLIRNKIQHNGNLGSTVFRGENESQSYRFEERFVSYWITKFPRLISFLWVKFYEFRNELRSYYSFHDGSNENYDFSLMPIERPIDSLVDVTDVVTLLNTSLVCHLEKGKLCILENIL